MRQNTLYRSDHTKTRHFGILRLAAFILIAAVLIRLFLFRSYRVEGDAMFPEFPHGSRVLVSRFIFGIRIPFFNNLAIPGFVSPQSGDVVFCLSPAGDGFSGFADFLEAVSFSLADPAPGRAVLVRRVIGVPGDLIRLDAEGVVYHNGKAIPRDAGRRITLHSLRPDPDTLIRVLEDGKTRTAFRVSPGRERIAEGAYPEKSDRDLYREADRTILQMPVPAGRFPELLRPFPRKETGLARYAAFAKTFILWGVLGDDAVDASLHIIRHGDARFQPQEGAVVVAWSDQGELWYAGRGETKLRPLVVFEGGELWLKVPEDRYFVLADNRDLARDSRSWGLVRHADILGAPFWTWSSP
jgi:signal peptidase I